MVFLKCSGVFLNKNFNILNVTKCLSQNYFLKSCHVRNLSAVQNIQNNVARYSTIFSYKNTNPFNISMLNPPRAHNYSTSQVNEQLLWNRGTIYYGFLGSSPLLNLHQFDKHVCKVSGPFLQYSSRNSSSKSTNIRSNLVSLKSKKRIQRKKTNLNELSEMEFEIVAFATAEEYDLQNLCQGLHKQGLYVEIPINSCSKKDDTESTVSKSSAKPEKVIHFGAAYQVSQEPRTMHIFHNGVIVFWNMPSLERNNILKFIKSYQTGGYDDEMVQEEADSLVYTYTNLPTKFKSYQNLVQLNEDGEKDLEKFTLSHVLAMSVKLGIWEASLERYIESIEHVTEAMQESGLIVLNQKQVLQRLGELFALRHFINLSSDLLDTPDFFWDHERLEILYNQLANHLSIRKRTSVMNTKLSHCSELMELLSSHLHEKHSSRLEWIIIVLIMIEVFFEVLHYV